MNDYKKLSNEFGSKSRKMQAHEKRVSLRKPSKEDLEELAGPTREEIKAEELRKVEDEIAEQDRDEYESQYRYDPYWDEDDIDSYEPFDPIGDDFGWWDDEG